MTKITQFDYHIFKDINDLAGSHHWLDRFMEFLANDAVIFLILGFIFYWFINRNKYGIMVIQAGLSVVISLGVNVILHHFIYRARPFVGHHVHKLIQHSADSSFPSDHSVFAFSIAATFFLYNKKHGVSWLLLACGIAFSRVWVGVHYPLDVTAGAIVGIIVSLFLYNLNKNNKFYQKMISQIIALYERIFSRVLKKNNTEYSSKN
jgi:undecaprenyl-diphosphatase